VAVAEAGKGSPVGQQTVSRMLVDLAPIHLVERIEKAPADSRKHFDPAARQKRQFEQLVHFTQKLLPEGEVKRQQWLAGADLSTPAKYNASIRPHRDYFHDEIIGKLP